MNDEVALPDVKLPDIIVPQEKNSDQAGLPQADRGWPAWRFAFVAFAIDGIVWGPPLCYGIFLPFKPYSELNPSLAASICTVCLGFLYCTGVILSPLVLRFPTFCSWSAWIGTLLCFFGLFGASYTRNVYVLLFTQGVMYGIGGSMIYTPNLIYLSEWWILRRGLIGGFTFSGSAAMGLVWTPIIHRCLEKYPVPLILRYYSIIWLALMLGLLPFFNGRLPKSCKSTPESTSMEYLKLPLFWFLNLINFIQSLAFYIPTIYCASYAAAMGGSESLPLELYTFASFPSQLIAGLGSDMIDSSWILFASCFLSSISVFLVWGFCKSFAMFCGFCTLYGLLAPACSSLYARFAMILAPKNPRSGSIVNFFFASRGIANIASGPIAGSLIKASPPSVGDFYWLINYCGTALLISSLGIGMRVFYSSSPEQESSSKLSTPGADDNKTGKTQEGGHKNSDEGNASVENFNEPVENIE